MGPFLLALRACIIHGCRWVRSRRRRARRRRSVAGVVCVARLRAKGCCLVFHGCGALPGTLKPHARVVEPPLRSESVGDRSRTCRRRRCVRARAGGKGGLHGPGHPCCTCTAWRITMLPDAPQGVGGGGNRGLGGLRVSVSAVRDHMQRAHACFSAHLRARLLSPDSPGSRKAGCSLPRVPTRLPDCAVLARRVARIRLTICAARALAHPRAAPHPLWRQRQALQQRL